MNNRKTVLKSQSMSGPRKRKRSKNNVWIKFLHAVFTTLSLFFKIINAFTHVVDAVKKLMDHWPG